MTTPNTPYPDQDTLTENLRNDEFWTELAANPDTARRALSTLTDVVSDLHAQETERKSDVDTAHLEGLRQGSEGKQHYFTARHEYREWLSRMRRFQRTVDQRRRQLREAIQAASPHDMPQRRRDKTDRRFHVATLAQAIYDHQMARGADGDEVDIELWSALNRTVATTDGPMSLRAALKRGYFTTAVDETS